MLRVHLAPTESACLPPLRHQPRGPPSDLFSCPASHRIELGRRYSVTRRGNTTGVTSLRASPWSLTVSRGGKSNQYQKVALRPSRRHTLNTGSGHTAQLTQAHPKGDHLQLSPRWHGSLCLHPPRRYTAKTCPRCASHPRESSLEFPTRCLAPSRHIHTHAHMHAHFWHLKVKRARRRRCKGRQRASEESGSNNARSPARDPTQRPRVPINGHRSACRANIKLANYT